VNARDGFSYYFFCVIHCFFQDDFNASSCTFPQRVKVRSYTAWRKKTAYCAKITLKVEEKHSKSIITIHQCVVWPPSTGAAPPRGKKKASAYSCWAWRLLCVPPGAGTRQSTCVWHNTYSTIFCVLLERKLERIMFLYETATWFIKTGWCVIQHHLQPKAVLLVFLSVSLPS